MHALYVNNIAVNASLLLMFHTLNTFLLLLYPPHRGYISFVNTCVTPGNIDLRP